MVLVEFVPTPDPGWDGRPAFLSVEDGLPEALSAGDIVDGQVEAVIEWTCRSYPLKGRYN